MIFFKTKSKQHRSQAYQNLPLVGQVTPIKRRVIERTTANKGKARKTVKNKRNINRLPTLYEKTRTDLKQDNRRNTDQERKIQQSSINVDAKTINYIPSHIRVCLLWRFHCQNYSCNAMSNLTSYPKPGGISRSGTTCPKVRW